MLVMASGNDEQGWLRGTEFFIRLMKDWETLQQVSLRCAEIAS
jgi:hypothetical protein